MGKDKTLPKFKPNQAGATAKYLRIPPRKARFVMDAVRGKYVSDALALLKFVPNFAAEAISAVIISATANAENSRPNDPTTGRPSEPLVAENLRVVKCFVDEGPRIKRVQPRAQGRAYRILKRMCHITIVVEEVEPKPRQVRAQRPSRRTSTAPVAPAKAVKAIEDTKAAVPATVEPVAVVPAVPVEVIVAEPAHGAIEVAAETASEHTEAPIAEAVAKTEAAAEAPTAD